MMTQLLTVSLPAPGQGAVSAATVHALLLDPERSTWAETWLAVDASTRTATWKADLDRPPSDRARLRVSAEAESAPGSVSQSVDAVLRVGATWKIGAASPVTAWFLPFGLDWTGLDGVDIKVGRSDGAGGLLDPVTVKLSSGSGPVSATISTEHQGELAYRATYRFGDGAQLDQPAVPVGASFVAMPAPIRSDLVISVDAELASALSVREVAATISTGTGTTLKHTFSGGFAEPWTVPLAVLGTDRGVAPVAELGYTVRYVKGALPDLVVAPERVAAPQSLTLRWLGAARIGVDVSLFDTMPGASVDVELVAPVRGRSARLTKQAPRALVSLAPDDRVAGDAGASAFATSPAIELAAKFQLDGGGTYRLEQSSASPVIDLVDPVGSKSVDLLPVFSRPDGAEIRRIQLSYRSLEQGPGWKIEGVTQTAAFKPGDGVVSYGFPAIDPGRAAVVYSGKIITASGAETIPETRATGPGLVVGGVDLWLSITVDPSLVDWTRYREVVVSLTQDAGSRSATVRFTASDGPAYWGFFGADEGDRVYSWSAAYSGRDGSHGSVQGSGESSPMLTLPKQTGRS